MARWVRCVAGAGNAHGVPTPVPTSEAFFRPPRSAVTRSCRRGDFIGLTLIFDIDKALSNASNVTKEKFDPESADQVKAAATKD